MSSGNIEISRNLNDKNYSEMADNLNTLLSGLNLGNNMNGQIIENIILPADGTELAISHNLKSAPKYRIILRQDEDAVILDGTTPWDDKKIYLKRGGSNTVTGVTITNPVINTIATNGLVPANISTGTLTYGTSTEVKITILLMRG